MSTRNPIRGKRRAVQAGDRFTYVVTSGPPAEAIAAFGGDAQAAVTAALTLLFLQLARPAATAAPALDREMPHPAQPEKPSEPKIDAKVLTQDFV